MAKSTIKLTKLQGTKSMWTFDESVTDMHGATLGELAKDISCLLYTSDAADE